MLEGVKKELCYGCSACATVCPKNSIEMIPDEEGFKYPVVDNVKCVGCGLCEKTCPVLQPKSKMIYRFLEQLGSYFIFNLKNMLIFKSYFF